MTPDPNRTTSIPKVMTVREVAEQLKYSPRYVRGLIHNGKLKATRLVDGGRFLIFKDSVDSLLGIRVQRPSRESLRRQTLMALARIGVSTIPGDGTL